VNSYHVELLSNTKIIKEIYSEPEITSRFINHNYLSPKIHDIFYDCDDNIPVILPK
jgi:hypothetical protein